MSSALLEFRYATRAIEGARPYQEDTSRVWRPNSATGEDRPLLAVLADGMGGHVSGEVASRVAAEQYVIAFAPEQGTIGQRLDHALIAGNDAIQTAVRKEKSLAGMGCTLVAGFIDQEGLRWASVGDSLLLLFRDGHLFRKNENHSLGALLDQHAQANVITEEEAKSSPRRHTLRSALTGAPIPLKQVEKNAHPLQHGDWIVLASDGLETLSGDAIAQLISEHKSSSPDELAQALVDQVTAAGLPNQDNTTVIAIHVVDSTLAPTQIVKGQKNGAAAHANGQPIAAQRAATGPSEPAERSAPVLFLVFALASIVLLGWLLFAYLPREAEQAGKPAAPGSSVSEDAAPAEKEPGGAIAPSQAQVPADIPEDEKEAEEAAKPPLKAGPTEATRPAVRTEPDPAAPAVPAPPKAKASSDVVPKPQAVERPAPPPRPATTEQELPASAPAAPAPVPAQPKATAPAQPTTAPAAPSPSDQLAPNSSGADADTKANAQ